MHGSHCWHFVRVAIVLVAAGCGEDTPARPLFASNYGITYAKVRDCRSSTEHGLVNVTVWATPRPSADAYRNGTYPFDVGTILLKEEWADGACTEPVAWTVMRKEAPGYDPGNGDWRWQRVVGQDRKVVEDGRVPACVSCHKNTCPERDFACTDP